MLIKVHFSYTFRCLPHPLCCLSECGGEFEIKIGHVSKLMDHDLAIGSVYS